MIQKVSMDERCEEKITADHSFVKVNKKIFLYANYKQSSNVPTLEMNQGGEYL